MSEKIHPPTPRRRQEAKEQGRGPRSREMVSAATLLMMTFVLGRLGPDLGASLMGSLSNAMTAKPRLSTDIAESTGRIASTVLGIGYMTLPLLLSLVTCAVLIQSLQSGLRIHVAKLSPSAARIAPSKRLSEIVSADSLGRLVVMIIKLIAVSLVGFYLARSRLGDLMTLPGRSLAGIATQLFEILVGSCLWIGMTLLAVSLLDYALAWWNHERDLMMTEQELREEMRDAQRASNAGPARTKAVQGVR